jgi:cyclic AMP-dependent transcription factor ATF-2
LQTLFAREHPAIVVLSMYADHKRLLAAHRGAFGDTMAELLIDHSSSFDLNVLGIETLPDSDFLAFLGDLADPLDPVPAAVPATGSLALPEATPKPPPLQLPAATEAQAWQVTTAQLLKQPSLRGSPCSSAASAEATNCPDSPMVSSPVTSSEAGQTAPATAATAVTAAAIAATNTRKRLRTQPPRATPAPSTVTQSTEQTQGTDSDEPPLTKAQLAAAKRRAPVVDWRAIDDPEERRKQRRLAKNRVTAARWVQVA